MKITRTTTFNVPVQEGTIALAQAVDRECNRIENLGNEIVAVSHARNEDTWSVLVAYCKASA